jgi:hypothetical protein
VRVRSRCSPCSTPPPGENHVPGALEGAAGSNQEDAVVVPHDRVRGDPLRTRVHDSPTVPRTNHARAASVNDPSGLPSRVA